MPSWKKIITSGSSDASLAALFVTNAVTSSIFSGSRFIGASFTGSFTGSLSGSLFGTSSFAVSSSRATTSSFALTSSFISTTGTNAFVQGGNSFGAAALIGTNDNQNFAIETNGSTKVTVDTSGNVGIGTTSPTGSLQVNGILSISNNAVIGQGNAYGTIGAANFTTLKLYDSSTGDTVLNNQGYNIQLQTAGSSKLTIANGGSVGIGTNTPRDTLDIVGSAILRSTYNLSWGNTYGAGVPTITGISGSSAVLAFFPAGSTSGEKVRINSAGNVGIGTTSPSYTLDVSGNIHATNTVYVDASNAAYLRGGDDHEWWDINVANTVGLYGVSNSAVGAIKLGSGGPTLYGASSNLGIGTTSPATLLDVNGTTVSKLYGGSGSAPNYAQFDAFMGGTDPTYGNNYAYFGMHRSGFVSWQLGMISSSFVIARGGGASQFTLWTDRPFAIDGSNNVGIGTITPSTRLHIAGSTQSTAASGVARLGFADSSSVALFTNADPAYGMLFGTLSSGKGWIQQQRVDGTATSYDLALQPNGGNVGIGTTSPTYKLDIVGASVGTTAGTQELLQEFNVTTSNNDYLELTNTRVSNGSTWETAGFRIQQKVDSTWMGYIQFNGNNNGGISFGTGLNAGAPLNIPEALRIVNGGNIGVRVTSPSSYLDIGGAQDTAGQISLQLRSGNSNANFSSNQITLGYNNSATYRHAIKTRHNSGAVSGNAIDFYTWKQSTDDLNTIGTQHVMSLDGPNVGIGVTSPTGKLHVSASGNPVIFVESDTDGDSTSTVLISGNKSGAPNYTATTLELRSNIDYRGRGILMTYTGGSEKWFAGVPYTGGGYQIGYSTTAPYDPPNAALYINSSKNIGIGTTTPGQKLDVIGRLKFRSDTSTTPGFWLTGNDGSEDVFVGLQSTTSTSAFGVYSAASWRFTILNGGNVGIGTTNPTEKLQVDGTIVTDYTIADTQGYRLIKPKNGTYITQTSTVTGAIKITYPVGYTNTMHTVKVKVYEYVTNESFTITFGGYNYSDTPSWYNCFAYIEGNPAIDRNFNVRFGYDGTYMVVYIGELSSTWSYPQVFIEEVGLGYSGVSSTWRNNNWTVGFEASAFSNVTATVSNTAAHTFVRDGANAYYSLGSIGIGASSPAYKLDVLGTIRATGDVIAYSDARVKDNVEPIENALEKVISLRGVSYNRKDTDDKSRKIGVIAQEVLPIIPEVVSKDQNGNYSVAYGNMVGLLIEAVKEQQKQIDELKYLLENKKKKK